MGVLIRYRGEDWITNVRLKRKRNTAKQRVQAAFR